MRAMPELSTRPLVAIIMGSKSDWETMSHASQALDALGIPHDVRVMSAHRTPAASWTSTSEGPRAMGSR